MGLSDFESPEQLTRTVNHLLSQFIFDDNRLETVCDRMIRDYKRGLQKSTNAKATMKMIPTYVTNFKVEHGKARKVLALDLGGTNFRVLLVDIIPGESDQMKAKCIIDSKIYNIPKPILKQTGEHLFDHVANCIADFIKRMKIENEKLPIGFTFSFPCKQVGLDKGILMTWTKGFSCSGCEGKDVGELLTSAIERHASLNSKNIQIAAICNDTVGTLCSCLFDEPSCKIGLIIGTGTNAAYVENTKNIQLLSDKERQKSSKMVVNCEWGNFGADGIISDIVTEYDIVIDKTSPNPGRQTFEKMISGMYLGELVRQILVKFHDLSLVFFDEDISQLMKPGCLDTALVSEILDCVPHDIVSIQNIIANQLGLGAVRHDCEVVYQVCEIISKRAAVLCGAAISGLAIMIDSGEEAELNDSGIATTELRKRTSSALSLNSSNGTKSKNSFNEIPIDSFNNIHVSCEGDTISRTESSLLSPISKRKTIVCGVDGTVYRKHPTFAKEMKFATNRLLPNHLHVKYVLSHDGSGKGAALTVITNAQ